MRKLLALFLIFACTSIALARMVPVVGGGVPAVGGPTLKDSNTGTATASPYQVGRYSNFLYVVGNFTAGSNYTLTGFDLYLSRVGTATGTFTPIIYATSSGAPTGTPTAGTAVNRSTLPTSEGVVNFTGFNMALTSGTEYCIGIYANSVNGDEDCRIYFSAGGGTYTHEMYNDADGTPAFIANNDEYLKFRTYGN